MGDEAVVKPNINALQQVLASPEMQDMFRIMAGHLVEAVDKDITILIPRPAEGGKTTVSNWFSTYHNRFLEIMLGLFHEASPGQDEEHLKIFIQGNLWPLVKDDLLKYILRRLAIRWAARQYTDATVVMPPEHEPYGWRLPLRIIGREYEFGQIALDEEGNIIKDKTTPREKFREVLIGAV